MFTVPKTVARAHRVRGVLHRAGNSEIRPPLGLASGDVQRDVYSAILFPVVGRMKIENSECHHLRTFHGQRRHQSSAANVKLLRDCTGLSLGKCAKALKDSNGDLEESKQYLIKSGEYTIEKLAARCAKVQTVGMLISQSRKRGIILNLQSETDFAAKSPIFIYLTNLILKIASVFHETQRSNNKHAERLEELKTFPVSLEIEDERLASSVNVKDLIDKTSSILGERLTLESVQWVTGDIVGGYVHDIVCGGEEKSGTKLETKNTDGSNWATKGKAHPENIEHGMQDQTNEFKAQFEQNGSPSIYIGKKGSLIGMKAPSLKNEDLPRLARYLSMHLVVTQPRYVSLSEAEKVRDSSQDTVGGIADDLSSGGEIDPSEVFEEQQCVTIDLLKRVIAESKYSEPMGGLQPSRGDKTEDLNGNVKIKDVLRSYREITGANVSIDAFHVIA